MDGTSDFFSFAGIRRRAPRTYGSGGRRDWIMARESIDPKIKPMMLSSDPK